MTNTTNTSTEGNIFTFKRAAKLKTRTDQTLEGHVINLPSKQSVTAVTRSAKKRFSEESPTTDVSEALLWSGQALEANARELERLLPAGHPGLECVERLSILSAYLIDCGEKTQDPL